MESERTGKIPLGKWPEEALRGEKMAHLTQQMGSPEEGGGCEMRLKRGDYEIIALRGLLSKSQIRNAQRS